MRLDVHVFLHHVEDPGLSGVLDTILERLDRLMAFGQDTLDALALIDAETNTVATRIQTLVDQLAAGGVSPAEQAAIKDKLSAELARLKTIGADPNAPVPPVPSPLAAMRRK